MEALDFQVAQGLYTELTHFLFYRLRDQAAFMFVLVSLSFPLSPPRRFTLSPTFADLSHVSSLSQAQSPVWRGSG